MPVAAQSSGSAISQEFQADDAGITAAALVSSQKDDPGSVSLATLQTASQLVGVVSDSPLIELSDGKNGVQVVSSGLTTALVSDLNGRIAAGDKVTASPLAGIGMKATESTTLVGIAQSALDISTSENRTLTDKSGSPQTVHIGLIQVQVGVVSYTPDQSERSVFVPAFLQDLANDIGGRNVSPVRVILASLILLLVFIGVAVLLYSTVRSSITAIGRNPLSEVAVRKSLLQVSLVVVGMLFVAAILLYLILTV